MKLAFLFYHDVLDDRVVKFFEELNIDTYTQVEKVKGKFHDTEPHLGTRTFPGHYMVKLIPFRDENLLNKLIEKIQYFNDKVAIKKEDEMHIFQLPLEKII